MEKNLQAYNHSRKLVEWAQRVQSCLLSIPAFGHHESGKKEITTYNGCTHHAM